MKYILSIDWDYFLSMTEKQYVHMPDGGNENLPKHVLDFIWTSRYAGHPDLLNIKTNITAMRAIGKVLNLNKGYESCKFMLANSHADIFPFICENIDPSEPITIVNIDEHHDFYYHVEDLNCGNWGWHVYDNFDLKKYIWYHNDHISKTGIEVIQDEPWFEKIRDDNFRGIQDCFYDLIFICKSLPWAPPHLDSNFIKFFKSKIPEYAYNKTFEDRFKIIKPNIQTLKTVYSSSLYALPGEFKKI
jgi:hypothetical protein